MSRMPSRRGLVVVTLVGGVSLVVGSLFAVRPALVLEVVPALRSVLDVVDPGVVVLLATIGLVLFAPTLGIVGKLRGSSIDPLVESNDSSATGRPGGGRNRRDAGPSLERGSTVGASFDRYVDRATAYEGDREVRSSAREELVGSLRSIAVTAYANRAGVTDEEATAAIETGTWTDDPRASALLSGEGGPSTPLWLWMFDLVSASDPFSRSLERTIDEIESLQSAAAIEPPTVEQEGDDAVCELDADADDEAAGGDDG
ncbi:DUF7269 family protein [Natrarchaeobius chitinivorans]|uniref:Uncharacterized protein n=1 Tax=Natrarchaeobius chitinivorans TaxID=1679083 RepID=A0A3N6LVY4_NATCH|nr:hypothetical protein [Natrarchaeobius chitinivorans]RQG91854.1 hypothetical protein EA473_18895 [Natrarchaeobius chitinivorans]